MPPGAETIEEQALREASIISAFLYLATLIPPQLSKYTICDVSTVKRVFFKAREKAERERKIKEIEEARARVHFYKNSVLSIV